jgi:hypothetical protein
MGVPFWVHNLAVVRRHTGRDLISSVKTGYSSPSTSSLDLSLHSRLQPRAGEGRAGLFRGRMSGQGRSVGRVVTSLGFAQARPRCNQVHSMTCVCRELQRLGRQSLMCTAVCEGATRLSYLAEENEGSSRELDQRFRRVWSAGPAGSYASHVSRALLYLLDTRI